jgi:hypothetical protein
METMVVEPPNDPPIVAEDAESIRAERDKLRDILDAVCEHIEKDSSATGRTAAIGFGSVPGMQVYWNDRGPTYRREKALAEIDEKIGALHRERKHLLKSARK